MGMSPDSHIKLTAVQIPSQLKCFFIVKDAVCSLQGLLALVQTVATRPIDHTAGMVIVEERYQHLMEHLHNGRQHCKSGCSVGTTYIVLICVINGAVQLLPLTAQPDSMRLYWSNMIHLNAFTLCCN